MNNRVFLAGAGGVVGRRLVPLLRGAGYEVHGTTRSDTKVAALREAGVVAVVVDVFDAEALDRAVAAARPDAVIHQLTDLPPGLDPARMAESVPRNARIRTEGTRNLVAAAVAAGATRIVAQSIAWGYAPGPEPHGEADPLDHAAEGARAVSIGGVTALEAAVLGAPLAGIVLRYGQFHGPGSGAAAPAAKGPTLHVDAAASAALLALRNGEAGVYNIAENEDFVATGKARRALGWDPAFRL